MGLIIDTGIFIRAERDGHRNPRAALPQGEEAAITSITLSELLEGVHLAASPARARVRIAFIEQLPGIVPILPFDEEIARYHAKLRAIQRSRGKMIGAHDLITAATAISLDWDVLTLNASEFRQIEGLGVREA
jgi:predicted nucleic acid-binding protein